MNNGRNIQYYAENFVLLVVQGFIDPFFMLYLTYVSYIVTAGRTMKILPCVQQQYEVKIWVNKHKETCYKPSHRTTNKHGETGYRLNCHEERCNRKRIHTHFLKDRNCEMQEGQNYLDSMQETHRWSHTSSNNIWQLEDPWWNKTSQGRHGVISWNLGINLWSWPWNDWKSTTKNNRSKLIGIAE